MNAFTQICITCNPNWIVRVDDILNNLSPVVTFSHIMYFRIYTMHQSMRKLTQMIPQSHCSWRIHSHMNAFTQICNKSNPNGNCHSLWHFEQFVTSCDIFTHDAFHDLYNASVNSKSNSDHSPISNQLALSFPHECIHANMHYMQSQLNCHSLWHFK